MCVLRLPIPSPCPLSQTHWGLFGPSASACALQLPTEVPVVPKFSPSICRSQLNLPHQFLQSQLYSLHFVPYLLPESWYFSALGFLQECWLTGKKLEWHQEIGPQNSHVTERSSFPGGPWQQRPKEMDRTTVTMLLCCLKLSTPNVWNAHMRGSVLFLIVSCWVVSQCRRLPYTLPSFRHLQNNTFLLKWKFFLFLIC